jgi:hypothetical protein
MKCAARKRISVACFAVSAGRVAGVWAGLVLFFMATIGAVGNLICNGLPGVT